MLTNPSKIGHMGSPAVQTVAERRDGSIVQAARTTREVYTVRWETHAFSDPRPPELCLKVHQLPQIHHSLEGLSFT